MGLILHIGLPKTGTTAIQQWLARNRPILLAGGIDVLNQAASHFLAVSCLDKRRRERPDGVAILGSTTQDSLFAEMRGKSKSASRTVVSSEYLSLVKPEKLRRVLTSCEAQADSIVCYLRRQDRLSAAGYSQEVKHMRYDRVVTRVLYSRHLDWELLTNAWTAAFPHARFVLRDYDSPDNRRDIVSSFKRDIGASDLATNDVLPKANVGASASETEFIRAMNQAGVRYRAADIAGLDRQSKGTPFAFSQKLTTKFEDIFRDRNRFLAAYGDGEFAEYYASNWLPVGADLTGKLPLNQQRSGMCQLIGKVTEPPLPRVTAQASAPASWASVLDQARVGEETLWSPDHLVESAWREHIPTAFWLVSLLKPRKLVELGVHNGVSYFAFCQAVKALATGTQCHGIDTWTGDAHAGKYNDDVFNDVERVNSGHYSSFSTLHRTTFDAALADFADLEIDLLHIDGFHTYDACKSDFVQWLPKMSDRGVIVFHDTEVRERDFGVWKLWAELAALWPSISFRHGHGLGLLFVGSKPPKALESILAGPPDSQERSILDSYFASRGADIERRWQILDLTERKRKVDATVVAMERTIAVWGEQKDALRQRVADIELALNAEVLASQELARTLEDLKGQLLQAMRSLATKDDDLTTVRERSAHEIDRLAGLNKRLRERAEAAETELAERKRQPGGVQTSRIWRLATRALGKAKDLS